MVLKRSRFQYRRQRQKSAMFEVKIKQLSAAKEDTDKKVIENETKTKMTARQPHGETTNGADIKQIHIKLEEQELQENKQAEWEMQQNSKFYNAQDEEQGL